MLTPTKFNRWFDRIPDPWRLIVFLTIASPAFVLNTSDNPKGMIAAACWIVFLAIVRLWPRKRGSSE